MGCEWNGEPTSQRSRVANFISGAILVLLLFGFFVYMFWFASQTDKAADELNEDQVEGTLRIFTDDAVIANLYEPDEITEDDPSWDCHVNGNKVCGPVTIIFVSDGFAVVVDGEGQPIANVAPERVVGR